MNAMLIKYLILCMMLTVCAVRSDVSLYEYVVEWGGRGTNDWEFLSEVGDIAIDASGIIYIADPMASRVLLFDESGNYLHFFSTYYMHENETNVLVPSGLGIDSLTNIYITHMGQNDSGIYLFSSAGQYITNIVSHGYGDGNVTMPENIIFDHEGRMVISDDMVVVKTFDLQGELNNMFGSFGDSDDQFQGISGVMVDLSGKYYVTDFEGHSVKVFSSQGEYIKSWGGGDGGFQYPGGLARNYFNHILVCDAYNHRIQVLDQFGEYISHFSHDQGNDGPFEPTYIEADHEGYLYIVDTANARIVKFAPTVSGPPVVSEPTSTNISSSTATLGGTVLDDGGGPIIERGIFWSIDEGFTPPSEGIKVSETGEFGEGTFSIDVTDLPPDTTIYFKAFARHIATSGYSDEASFSTGAESIIYVNSEIGDDAYSGYSSTVSGMSGPKATLEAAMAIAVTGATIEIAGGDYPELPLTVIMGGRDITLRTSGSVTISEEE